MSVARSRLDLRFLAGAFLAVALTFVAASAVTQHAMRRIDAASDEIAFDSAPSIQRLAAVRTGVRHTEFLLGRALGSGESRDRVAVDPALAQLHAEANAYLTLPTFPGEKELWRELNNAITTFDGAVQRTLAHLDAGAATTARAGIGAVATAADRVSEACARAIEFNAQNGRDLALSIKEVRRNATYVGYALNVSCVVFALCAALLVGRQVRRYGTLVEEHAALEESRASELESFAGRAAHDIMNPISATQMALALALKRDVQDARVRELVDRALRNLLRVRTIIDGLLQFARAGARPGPGVDADVATVIDDVAAGIRPAADAAGIELRVEGVSPCRVRCSVGVLTSVISNLVQNAVKHMDEHRPTRRIALRAEDRGDVVHFEVEDTGPGIAPELLSDIFLPYVRGPNRGTEGIGLGLATVKRLCEAHGGTAGVRSSVGQGSVFWFELPRSSEAASPSGTATSDGAGTASTRRGRSEG
ncbi:MAG TPA: HAMP domain-containing sensor histidine kinase [Anaeromyxobacteraceae bacterium]|nr:HAMP domain-containing sensor histidine kinase [Anaeromyxobacteraceae bacterium]